MRQVLAGLLAALAAGGVARGAPGEFENLVFQVRKAKCAPAVGAPVVKRVGNTLRVSVRAPASARFEASRAAMRAALGELVRGQRADAAQQRRIADRLDSLARILAQLPEPLTKQGAALTFKEEGRLSTREIVAELNVPDTALRGAVTALGTSDKAVLVSVAETVDGAAPVWQAGSPFTPRLLAHLRALGYDTYLAAAPPGNLPDPFADQGFDALAGWVADVRVTTRALPPVEDIKRYAARAELLMRNLRTGEVRDPVVTGELLGTGTAADVAADDARKHAAVKLAKLLKGQTSQVPPPHVIVDVPNGEPDVLAAIRQAIEKADAAEVTSTPEGPSQTRFSLRSAQGAAAVAAAVHQALPDYELVASEQYGYKK